MSSDDGVPGESMVVGDLLTRDRRGDRDAVVVTGGDRRLSYHDFVTTAWKTGNFLRYLGVAPGALVAVAPDPLPEPVLTFLGAALLGARTRFEPVTDGSARAVVVHREDEAALDLPPETKLAVYGGPPTEPTTTHWEGTVWSENPAFPPTAVAADDVALESATETFSHGDLVGAASAVAAELSLEPGVVLRVEAPLSAPRSVAGGVLAPLASGATVALTPDTDRRRLVVADDPDRAVALDEVPL